MLQFYHYPKCSACQKASKWLKARGVSFEPIDITVKPPSLSQLKLALKVSKRNISDFFNKSGEQYRLLNMKDKIKTLSEEELLSLLSQNGKLIKRPFIFDGKNLSLGFKEEEFENFLV